MKHLLYLLTFLVFNSTLLVGQNLKLVWSDKNFEAKRYAVNENLNSHKGVTYFLRVPQKSSEQIFHLEKYDSVSFKFIEVVNIPHVNVSQKKYKVEKITRENGLVNMYESYKGPKGIVINRVVIDLEAGTVVSVTSLIDKPTKSIRLLSTPYIRESRSDGIVSVVMTWLYGNFNVGLIYQSFDLRSGKPMHDLRMIKKTAQNEKLLSVFDYKAIGDGNILVAASTKSEQSLKLLFIEASTGKMTSHELKGIPEGHSVGKLNMKYTEGVFHIRASIEMKKDRYNLTRGFLRTSFNSNTQKFSPTKIIQSENLHYKKEIVRNNRTDTLFRPTLPYNEFKWFDVGDYLEVVQSYRLTRVFQKSKDFIDTDETYMSNVNFTTIEKSGQVLNEKITLMQRFYRPPYTDLSYLFGKGESMYVLWGDVKSNLSGDEENMSYFPNSKEAYTESVLVYENPISPDSDKTIIFEYPERNMLYFVENGVDNDETRHRRYVCLSSPSDKTFRMGYIAQE